MNKARGISRERALVAIALVGALGFSLFLGYLAWTNDSFPIQQRPFRDYASVTAASFNGTEFSFTLQWSSSDYVPMYAQLTSDASDAANTPVCDLGLKSVSAGQTIIMPFGLGAPSTALSQVDLWIAVQSVRNGTQFSIVYHVDNVTAAAGDILPKGLSCTQPNNPP